MTPGESQTAQALLRTPLYANHVAHGGKLVEFGGWEMPLQFSRVLEEHHAVRRTAGLFDISHMAILTFAGPNPDLIRHALNTLVPQDLDRVPEGKAVYTQFLNENGGTVDDIIVYHLPHLKDFPELNEWTLICNAANKATVCNWLETHLPPDVSFSYQNPCYSLIALQGPAFSNVLQALGAPAATGLPRRFHIGQYALGDVPVLLSRTGYTGEDGVEIVVHAAQAGLLWEALLRVGQPFGLVPVGLAARDTLRLEAAYPLHGSELNADITPLEAGLAWSVKLNKPADFVGKSALLAQNASGLTRHFVCFTVLKKAIPRHHDLIYDELGQLMGSVTSGSISPTLDVPIGVGYINASDPPAPGTAIQINIRGHLVPAQVTFRPFYSLTTTT